MSGFNKYKQAEKALISHINRAEHYLTSFKDAAVNFEQATDFEIKKHNFKALGQTYKEFLHATRDVASAARKLETMQGEAKNGN